MTKWVTDKLEELLQQLNEVPYTDDREQKQLTILMNGFARVNSQAMDNAAARTRSQLSEWSLDDAVNAKKTENHDEAADELTKLRPIR